MSPKDSVLIQKMDMEKKQIEQELKLYLGESECAEGEGYRVSWKNVATNRLDQQRLKVERPDIYKEYLKSTDSRRLNIREIGGIQYETDTVTSQQRD